MSTETFCQLCRHLTPGHQPGCPVATREPVRSSLASGYQGVAGHGLTQQEYGQGWGQHGQQPQSGPCPYCGGVGGNHLWGGGQGCPGARGYTKENEVAGTFGPSDDQIFALRQQVDTLLQEIRLLRAQLEARRAI